MKPPSEQLGGFFASENYFLILSQYDNNSVAN